MSDNSLVMCRDGELETIELSEDFVNPGQPRTRPQDFELLKLLGKGGYGKVSLGGYFFNILCLAVLECEYTDTHICC